MQCHCYVCDLLAPCLKWGTGISSTDHCHATNKAEMWKIQRNNLKLGKSAQLPVSTNDISPSTARPQNNRVLPLGIQSSENSMLHIQAYRTNTALTQGSQAVGRTVVRACSSSRHSTLQKEDSMPNSILVRPSTTFSVPSGTNHGRCQRSGSTLARNRYQPHIISRQFLGVRNKAIQRDRRHGGGDSGPQFHRSCLIPRVVNNSGATVTVNHSGLGSSGLSNPIHPAEQYDRYHDATTGLSNVRDDNSWNNVWLTTNLSSYSQPSPALPSLNCVSGNTVTTQEFCQPLTQCNDSHNTYQSCVLSNEVPSHVACPDSSSNQHGNELQFRSQNENAGENIIHCGNPSQDTSQQQPHEGNQSRTGEKGDLLVLDASSTEPVIEDSHADVGSCIAINQPPIVKESDVQCAGSTNLGAVDDIENWLFDKDSVVGVGDSNFSFLDMSSPDLSSIETGMLLF